MPPVRPGRHSTVRVTLDEYEGALLRDLANQMRSLLEEEHRDDPVMQRVFPDAYESVEDAKSFRELTERELKSAKVAALEKIIGSVEASGSVERSLTVEEAETWLTALTDLRLALGTRLGVTEETMSQELDTAHPEAPALSALHWLGWLQESMLEALSQTLEGRRH